MYSIVVHYAAQDGRVNEFWTPPDHRRVEDCSISRCAALVSKSSGKIAAPCQWARQRHLRVRPPRRFERRVLMN